MRFWARCERSITKTRHLSCVCIVKALVLQFETWHVFCSQADNDMNVCTHCFPFILFSCCLLWFIHPLVLCCCVFVSFLVVSGKLKCHPSPIHRPDWDRKLSSPSIILPSSLHSPISTYVSVVMGNSDKRTLLGKKKQKTEKKSSSWAFKVKLHQFILLFPPLMHSQNPHLIYGQIVAVFPVTVVRLLFSTNSMSFILKKREYFLFPLLREKCFK